MRLVIPLSEPLHLHQATAGGGMPDISALVDRLSNRLGAGKVVRAEAVESDVPERSVRFVPALARPGATWPASWPAPLRLLHPPQEVEALAALPLAMEVETAAGLVGLVHADCPFDDWRKMQALPWESVEPTSSVGNCCL